MPDSQVEAAMLFAAGFGTRMGVLTRSCPKPLIRVAGRPLIDHALALVRDADVPKTVVNTHYLAHMVAEHLAGQDVQVAQETDQILDTGGGLKNAAPYLATDTTFTLNTDTVWKGPNPLTDLQAQWNPSETDALLLCVPVENVRAHSGAGDFSLSTDGSITRGAGYVYGGAQIIKMDTLRDISDRVFSLNMIWDRLISTGRCKGAVYTGLWCDVGHPDGITQAEAMLIGSNV